MTLPIPLLECNFMSFLACAPHLEKFVMLFSKYLLGSLFNLRGESVWYGFCNKFCWGKYVQRFSFSLSKHFVDHKKPIYGKYFYSSFKQFLKELLFLNLCSKLTKINVRLYFVLLHTMHENCRVLSFKLSEWTKVT